MAAVVQPILGYFGLQNLCIDPTAPAGLVRVLSFSSQKLSYWNFSACLTQILHLSASTPAEFEEVCALVESDDDDDNEQVRSMVLLTMLGSYSALFRVPPPSLICHHPI